MSMLNLIRQQQQYFSIQFENHVGKQHDCTRKALIIER